MKRIQIGIFTLGLLGLFFTPIAEARKNDRTGFNFGSSIRLMTVDDHTNADVNSEKDLHTKSSSQLISPYIGYAFSDLFNLGLLLSFEERNQNTVETSKDGLQEIDRKTETSTKSASLFGRFLFGQILFLETGGGVYYEDTNIENEYTSDEGDGIFKGKKEKYDVTGFGPGYHLGGGIDLPMGGGFFFNSAYMVKIYQLRDSKSSLEVLGKRRSLQQKREITFGVSHYLN